MAKPDEGHILTEKALAKLEKKIASVYGEAAKEMQTTIDEYFSSFAKRDEEMKSLIGSEVNGKEWTKEDYKKWRLNQIGRGKRMEALRDKIAERVTEANETAVAYVNDATPGIYSLNRNYTAYTIEQISPNADFTLWDEQTVKRLITESPDLMPYYPKKMALKRGIDLEYGKKQITASITSSILQGKSIKHMADDLQARIGDMSRTSAIRTARTAVTEAQNAGRMDSYRAAQDMGISLKREWVAALDNRTRHAHAMLDGQKADIDKPFKVDGYEIMYPGDRRAPGYLVYNCRCTLVADVDGVDTSNAQRRARNPETGQNELVSDMSYQEWAGWKEKEQKTVAKSIENSENSSKIEIDNKTVDSHYCTNSEYSDAVKLHGKNISKEDKKQIEWHEKADGSNGGYVASRNYSVINSHLRGDGFAEKPLDEDDRRTIDALRRAISNNTLGGDYTLTRYLNADYISNVFGVMDDDGLLLGNLDILNATGRKGRQRNRILSELADSLGSVITEKAFVSTSMIPSKNVVSAGKAVKLTIKASADTHCFIPKNKKESECILADGTRYRIDDIFISKDGLIELVVTIL